MKNDIIEQNVKPLTINAYTKESFDRLVKILTEHNCAIPDMEYVARNKNGDWVCVSNPLLQINKKGLNNLG
jgi:hypothetical protein